MGLFTGKAVLTKDDTLIRNEDRRGNNEIHKERK